MKEHRPLDAHLHHLHKHDVKIPLLVIKLPPRRLPAQCCASDNTVFLSTFPADRTDETNRALEQKREIMEQMQEMQRQVKNEQSGEALYVD